jgi:hypothetical protein
MGDHPHDEVQADGHGWPRLARLDADACKAAWCYLLISLVGEAVARKCCAEQLAAGCMASAHCAERQPWTLQQVLYNYITCQTLQRQRLLAGLGASP